MKDEDYESPPRQAEVDGNETVEDMDITANLEDRLANEDVTAELPNLAQLVQEDESMDVKDVHSEDMDETINLSKVLSGETGPAPSDAQTVELPAPVEDGEVVEQEIQCETTNVEEKFEENEVDDEEDFTMGYGDMLEKGMHPSWGAKQSIAAEEKDATLEAPMKEPEVAGPTPSSAEPTETDQFDLTENARSKLGDNTFQLVFGKNSPGGSEPSMSGFTGDISFGPAGSAGNTTRLLNNNTMTGSIEFTPMSNPTESPTPSMRSSRRRKSFGGDFVNQASEQLRKTNRRSSLLPAAEEPMHMVNENASTADIAAVTGAASLKDSKPAPLDTAQPDGFENIRHNSDLQREASETIQDATDDILHEISEVIKPEMDRSPEMPKTGQENTNTRHTEMTDLLPDTTEVEDKNKDITGLEDFNAGRGRDAVDTTPRNGKSFAARKDVTEMTDLLPPSSIEPTSANALSSMQHYSGNAANKNASFPATQRARDVPSIPNESEKPSGDGALNEAAEPLEIPTDDFTDVSAPYNVVKEVKKGNHHDELHNSTMPITFKDFLDEADISFLDHLRRATSIGFADIERSKAPETMKECLATISLISPDVLQHEQFIAELDQALKETKHQSNDMEDALNATNPALFGEIQMATGDNLDQLKHKVQGYKRLCRMAANLAWKEWRRIVESRVSAALAKNLSFLQADTEFLEDTAAHLGDFSIKIKEFASAAEAEIQKEIDGRNEELERRARLLKLRSQVEAARKSNDKREVEVEQAKEKNEMLRSRQGQLQAERSRLSERLQSAELASTTSGDVAGEKNLTLSKLGEGMDMLRISSFINDWSILSLNRTSICLKSRKLFLLHVKMDGDKAHFRLDTQDDALRDTWLPLLELTSWKGGTGDNMFSALHEVLLSVGRLESVHEDLTGLHLDCPHLAEVRMQQQSVKLCFVHLGMEIKMSVDVKLHPKSIAASPRLEHSTFIKYPGAKRLTAMEVDGIIRRIPSGFGYVRRLARMIDRFLQDC